MEVHLNFLVFYGISSSQWYLFERPKIDYTNLREYENAGAVWMNLIFALKTMTLSLIPLLTSVLLRLGDAFDGMQENPDTASPK